jgi:hypothetical protein
MPASAAAQRIWRSRDPNGDQTPDLADYVNEGERPTMAEVIDRLHLAGVPRTGCFATGHAPLVGLAVPETSASLRLRAPLLGHRRRQRTGDLMFSPDYQFFDAAPAHWVIPPDRVVPPDFAAGPAD